LQAIASNPRPSNLAAPASSSQPRHPPCSHSTLWDRFPHCYHPPGQRAPPPWLPWLQRERRRPLPAWPARRPCIAAAAMQIVGLLGRCMTGNLLSALLPERWRRHWQRQADPTFFSPCSFSFRASFWRRLNSLQSMQYCAGRLTLVHQPRSTMRAHAVTIEWRGPLPLAQRLPLLIHKSLLILLGQCPRSHRDGEALLSKDGHVQVLNQID
jgi:hypothetical protein